MKYRYALLPILLLVLMVSPAFAFWHPPPDEERPPCTYFGVLINGAYGTASKPYAFKEPTDNYCDDVKVEVFIANVTDLYGYYFELWWNPTYFSLKNYTIEATWPSQFVVMPDASYAKTMPYKQAVSAVAPSTGVTGDFKLATLFFHIDNDVCWMQQKISGLFELYNWKASDSCSGKIDTCGVQHGYWTFTPVQPKITLTPADEVNSKVGEKFTLTVTLENIVKMTDFDIAIDWHGHQFEDEPAVWTAILCTTKADVVVNEEVFPTANRSSTSIIVTSPLCNVRYAADPVGTVQVTIVMKPAYHLINGTFWLFKVTFTKCDPWFCGSQPEYTPKGDHDWTLENATTTITARGAISVKCPDPLWMYLCTDVLVENAKFTFVPIPGDLDGSGHVDITDIMIEAGYYGYETVEPWPGLPPKYITFYYDLNNDKVIDIYDVVIVAKNFCRTAP